MDAYEKQLQAWGRAKKRHEREELRVAREIGRRRKEQEKAEERERAELEVAAFRAQLEVVLSLHREVGETWNWWEIAHSLPPHPPTVTHRRENRVLQNLAVANAAEQKTAEASIEEARRGDRLENEAAERAYRDDQSEWTRMTALARRVLAGDVAAYQEAVTEFSPLAEMEHLGSSIDFTMHTAGFAECVLTMKDASAVPSEIKSLTGNGKLSTKAMPRQQFHELYQDYVCGGVLRAGREILALLPVQDVLVTAVVPVTDPDGRESDRPVLSVVITRSAVTRMNFEKLDPSDAVETLVFRGDFKSTRKAGAFQPISPIRFEEIALPCRQNSGIEQLVRRATVLRNELKMKITELQEVSIK